MKRKLYGIIAELMVFVMLFSGVPITSFAAETEGTDLPLRAVDETYLEEGSFYLGNDTASLNENEAGPYYLRIFRYGSAETEQTVRLNMMDVTAKYGKDYKLKPADADLFGAHVEGAKDSKSLQELVQSEQGEEYNYSDAIIDGLVTAENQLTEEEESAEAEKLCEELQEVNTPSDYRASGQSESGESEKSESEGPEELETEGSEAEESESEESESNALSLADAWALQTGLENDKGTMTYDSAADFLGLSGLDSITEDSVDPYLSDGSLSVMEELNSAYLDIRFEAGETERIVELSLIDDEDSTGQLQAIFSLTAVEDSVISEEYGDFTLFIEDDEPYEADKVSFTSAEYSPENGYITVVIEKTGSLSQITAVMLDTESMTAVPSENFSEVHTEVYFLYGNSTRNIKIPVISTGLTEDVQFKVKLQEPVGCEIGEISEAICTIHPEDESFEVLQQEAGGLTRSGAAASSDETEFSATAEDGTERKDIGIWDDLYDSNERWDNPDSCDFGNGDGGSSCHQDGAWKLFAKTGLFTGSRTSYAYFDFASKYGKDVSKHYEYKGFIVGWRKDSTNGFNWTRIFSRHGRQGEGDYIWGDDQKTWSRNDTYYIGATDLDQVGFKMEASDYCNRSHLWINVLVPVKRVFQINLLESAPVKMINADGQIVNNTDNAGYEYLNKVELGTGGTTMNVVSGYHVTVALPANNTQMTYIKGIEMVKIGSDGKEKGATTIWQNTGNEFPRTATFELTPKMLETCRDYYELIKADGYNKNSYGKICIRAVVEKIPVKVKVKNDSAVNWVKLWDGANWVDNGQAEGDAKVYTYGLGDQLRIKAELKESETVKYSWAGFTVSYKNTAGKTLSDTWNRRSGEEFIQRKLDAAEYEVSTQLSENKNRVVVMVPVDQDGKFDHTQGIFTSPREKLGQYYRYIVDDVSVGIPGKEYALTAKLSEDYAYSCAQIWKESADSTQYAQETYYYKGSSQIRKNVLFLSVLQNPVKNTYHLTGTVYYDNAIIGQAKTQTGWYPAEGVYAYIDAAHYGISDADGVFSFANLRAPKNYKVKIKLDAGGSNTRYCIISLGDSDEINIGKHILTSNTQDHPHFTTLKAVGINKKGQEKTYPITDIRVANEDEMIWTKLVANVNELDDNGDPYTYTYVKEGKTVTAEEKVKGVEFVVIDGTTHKKKAVYKAEQGKTTGEWTYMNMFTRGHYSEYEGGDQMYARIITDRKIDNGEKVVFEEKTYPITNTGLPFVDQSPKEPNKITIELPTENNYRLPVIGNLNVILALKNVNFGITKAGNNAIRLFIGVSIFTQDNNFDEMGNLKSDAGLVITKDNFKSGFSNMVNRIKQDGKRSGDLQGQTLGLTSWTITPMIGIYFELAIRKDITGMSFVYVGGGGYFGVDTLFRYTQYFAVMGIPTYVGGAVEITLLQELGVARDKEYVIPFSENPFGKDFFAYLRLNTHFEYIFRGILCGDAYAGVGICNTLGVRGGFRLNIYFIHNPTIKKTYPNYRSTGFAIDGNLQFWSDVVLLSVPWPAFSWMKTDPLRLGYFADIYGNDGEEDLTFAPGEITAKARTATSSEAVFDGDAATKESAELGAFWAENVTNRTIVSNAYDEASQKLITIDDTAGAKKVLMVYLEDDKTRTDAERTRLMYSVYEEATGVWSDPLPVNPDGATADLQPSLCDCGDTVLISWVSRKEQTPITPVEGEYSDYLSTLEIYTAQFDKNGLSVGSVKQMTSDAYMDVNPKAIYEKDENSGKETILLSYLKSEVGSITTAEELIRAAIPQTNKAVMTYQLYEKETASEGSWKKDYYDEEVPVASSSVAKKLEDQLQGQRFVASPIEEFGVNNPIVSDYDVATVDMPKYTEEELQNELYGNAGVTKAELDSEDPDVRGKAKKKVDDWKKDSANEVAVNALKAKEAETTKYGIYAFVAESDSSTSTTGDREIFVQLYDYATHTFSEPRKITANDLSESNLKLVTNGDETYLFWVSGPKAESTESGDKQSRLMMADLSDMVNSSVLPNAVTVNPADADDDMEGISLNDYSVYMSDAGNLQIVWQESGNEIGESEDNSTSMKQDLYTCAMIKGKNGDAQSAAESKAVSWSPAVQITDESGVSGIPAMAGLSDDRILMMSNSFEMNLGTERSAVSNATIREYMITPASNPVSKGLTVTTVRSDQGRAVTLTLKVKNEGLRPAENYSYDLQLYHNDEAIGEAVSGSEGYLLPGAETGITAQYQLLDDQYEEKENLSLHTLIVSDSAQETEYFYKLTDPLPQYSFCNVELEQQGDAFCVTGTLENRSNADMAEGDMLQVLNAEGKLLVEQPVTGFAENLGSFMINVPITAENTSYGTTTGYLRVVREDQLCSEATPFTGYLVNPVGLSLEGVVDDCLTVKVGSTVLLNGTFNRSLYLSDASLQYSVENTAVATVDGNVLRANKVGETELIMSVDPYGGSKTIKLIVEKKPSARDDSSDTTVTRKGPAGAVQLSGAWKQNADGTWSFIMTDGKPATGWGKTGSGSNTEYWHFNEQGVMDTGWYLDTDGNWYYLHETSDGRKGAMDRGWHYDSRDSRWYYLDPEDGKMKKGWVYVSGKWYYLAPGAEKPSWKKNVDGRWTYSGSGRPYGSMYANETTPDGYKVGADGAWIP